MSYKVAGIATLPGSPKESSGCRCSLGWAWWIKQYFLQGWLIWRSVSCLSPERSQLLGGQTDSGVPVMAVLPVIRDLWPNLARRGRTKGVRQQIAAGAEQKPPLLMRQKACGSPSNPQELPGAAQTKPEIKKSQRQAHFYSRAKVFLFHGLGGLPVWDRNRAEQRFAIFSHRFRENRFLIFFFLFYFPALSTFTPPTTLCGLIL